MLPVMRSGSGRGQWECSTHECCAPPGARRSRGPATLVFARPCQSAVYVIAHRGCVHLSTSPMTRLRTARPRGTRRPSTREGSAHCRCEWCDASCLVSAAAAVNAHCCERSRTCLLPPGRALCGAARRPRQHSTSPKRKVDCTFLLSDFAAILLLTILPSCHPTFLPSYLPSYIPLTFTPSDCTTYLPFDLPTC